MTYFFTLATVTFNYNNSLLFTFYALLISAVTLAVIEKRRRKLILQQSSEVKRINNLANIDAVEKQHLINALDCFPEVIEEYPLPDIHLRLTAMLSKYYALFKLMNLVIFLFFALKSISFLTKTAEKIGGQLTYNHTETMVYSTIIISGINIIIALIAVGEFLAGRKVSYGSIKAQYFLIFSWILNPFILSFGLIADNLWLNYLVITPIAIYILWVLLFRKNAKQKISAASKPANFWTKFIAVFIVILSFVLVMFSYYGLCVKLNINSNNETTNYQMESSESSSYGGSTFGYKINRIRFLIIDKNDQQLVEVVKKLAKFLQQRFPKIKMIIHDELKDNNKLFNYSNEAVFAVGSLAYYRHDSLKREYENYESAVKNTRQENKLPNWASNSKETKLTKLFASLNSYNKKEIWRYEAPKKHFYIKLLFQKYIPVYYSHKLFLNYNDYLGFNYKYIYDSNEEKVYNTFLKSAKKSFVKTIDKHQKNRTKFIELPEYICKKVNKEKSAKHNIKDLSFMKKATLLGSFYGKTVSERLVYRIDIKKTQDIIKVVDELRAEFKEKKWSVDVIDEYNFQKNDTYVRIIFPELYKDRDSKKLKIMEYSQNYLLMNVIKFRKNDYGQENIDRLFRENPRLFTVITCGKRFSEQKRLEIYSNILTTVKILSFAELERMYTNVKKLKKLPQDKKEQLLKKIQREIIIKSQNISAKITLENSMKSAKEAYNIINFCSNKKVVGNYFRNKIFAIFKNFHTVVNDKDFEKATPLTNDKNYVVEQKRLKLKNIIKSPQLLTIFSKKVNYKPITLLVYSKLQKNGKQLVCFNFVNSGMQNELSLMDRNSQENLVKKLILTHARIYDKKMDLFMGGSQSTREFSSKEFTNKLLYNRRYVKYFVAQLIFTTDDLNNCELLIYTGLH